MNHTQALTRKQLAGDRDKATSSEMRYDWLADRWVIMAPHRTARPDDFIRHPDSIQDPATCPFCRGRETETPTAVATYPRDPSGKSASWRVRVVPNKFPAVKSPVNGLLVDGLGVSDFAVEESADESTQTERIDLFLKRELFGGHEVIIESPKHIQSITDLDQGCTELVFRAYRDRLRYWLEEQQSDYAVLFKNVGFDAGASLAHTHSQLIATDLLPTSIKRAVERMQLFFGKESCCLYCRMAQDEVEQEIRIVEQTSHFVAFCPFASRTPYLVSIVPKKHDAHFERMTDSAVQEVSWLTHRLIRRIEKCCPDSAYNFIIQTAPKCAEDAPYYHWRIELFPRLTKVAGFEWGSDCFINPISPEDAARCLRRAGVGR